MVDEPPSKTCPRCGAYNAQSSSACFKCGYVFSSPVTIPSGSSIPHMNVPTNYSGTLTLSASAAQAIYNFDNVNSLIMERNLEDSDPILYESISNAFRFASAVMKKQDDERRKEKPEDIREYERKIEELKKLVNEDKDEPIFQRFFNDNIHFIEPSTIKYEEKVYFGGEYIPDFLIETSTEQYIIVEIESPGKRLYTKGPQPTELFTQAMTQMGNYLQWARKNR